MLHKMQSSELGITFIVRFFSLMIPYVTICVTILPLFSKSVKLQKISKIFSQNVHLVTAYILSIFLALLTLFSVLISNCGGGEILRSLPECPRGPPLQGVTSLCPGVKADGPGTWR